MKKKLQVFVSSTYLDMRDERQAAVEAILRAGHIPAGMELFAAGDESQWDTIRRWIDDSDVFMLILGGRYGSIEPKSGKSYIELEYDYATEIKKPLFAAVISDVYLDAKVRSSGPDVIERKNGNLLEEFRKIVTSKISRFFDSIDGLKVIVFESLGNFQEDERIVGWIRASEAIDPKATLEEINRLQHENASLNDKTKDLEALLLSFKSGNERSLADLLDDDAKALLVRATKEGRYIHFLYSVNGQLNLNIGKFNFITTDNHRDIARWESVIEKLSEHKLLKGRENDPRIFELTDRGYKVADEIEAKASDALIQTLFYLQE